MRTPLRHGLEKLGCEVRSKGCVLLNHLITVYYHLIILVTAHYHIIISITVYYHLIRYHLDYSAISSYDLEYSILSSYCFDYSILSTYYLGYSMLSSYHLDYSILSSYQVSSWLQYNIILLSWVQYTIVSPGIILSTVSYVSAYYLDHKYTVRQSNTMNNHRVICLFVCLLFCCLTWSSARVDPNRSPLLLSEACSTACSSHAPIDASLLTLTYAPPPLGNPELNSVQSSQPLPCQDGTSKGGSATNSDVKLI